MYQGKGNNKAYLQGKLESWIDTKRIIRKFVQWPVSRESCKGYEDETDETYQDNRNKEVRKKVIGRVFQ